MYMPESSIRTSLLIVGVDKVQDVKLGKPGFKKGSYAGAQISGFDNANRLIVLLLDEEVQLNELRSVLDGFGYEGVYEPGAWAEPESGWLNFRVDCI